MKRFLKVFRPCTAAALPAFAVSLVRFALWVDRRTGYDTGPLPAVSWCAVVALCLLSAVLAALVVRGRSLEARPPAKACGVSACISGALYAASSAAALFEGEPALSETALWVGRAGIPLGLAAGAALLVCGVALVRGGQLTRYAAALLTVPAFAAVRAAYGFLSSIINGADTTRVMQLMLCLVSALCAVKIIFALAVDSLARSLGGAVVFALFAGCCALCALPAVPLVLVRNGLGGALAMAGDAALCAFGLAASAGCCGPKKTKLR